MAYEVLRTGLLDTHISSIRDLYGRQCGAILDSLMRHISTSVHWNRLKGDMLIWVGMPEGIDTTALLEKAIVCNMAFVPNTPLYANAPHRNAPRLAFVTVVLERIKQDTVVLDGLIRAEIAALTSKVT